MRKYWLFFKNAVKNQIKNPSKTFMLLLLFLVLIFASQKLWIAINNKSFNSINLVWYLVINQALILSYDDRIQRNISNSIRSGNIGYSLIRPISYFGQLISEAFGVFVARFPIMIIGGSILAYILTGGFPTTFYGMVVAFVLMLISSIFVNICLVGIGISAMYMQSANSMYMIWHKLMFVFGGIMFPLTIYPRWMQNFASATPFSYSMYEISRLIYEFDWAIVWNTLIHLVLWILITLIFVRWMISVLLKKVSINGG